MLKERTVDSGQTKSKSWKLEKRNGKLEEKEKWSEYFFFFDIWESWERQWTKLKLVQEMKIRIAVKSEKTNNGGIILYKRMRNGGKDENEWRLKRRKIGKGKKKTNENFKKSIKSKSNVDKK